MTETMKVTEAIGSMKIQEERIMNALTSLKPVGVKRANAKKIDGITVTEYTNKARAQYESLIDLTNRYIAMKEAVNGYNASTKINVAGQEMTVASAIYLKDHGIAEKEEIVTYLIKALRNARNYLEAENGDKLDAAAERNAKQNFEGDPKSDKTEYLKFLEEYREKHQYELIDPLEIEKKIERLSDEIAKFKSGVDTAIQIANATHDITITY